MMEFLYIRTLIYAFLFASNHAHGQHTSITDEDMHIMQDGGLSDTNSAISFQHYERDIDIGSMPSSILSHQYGVHYQQIGILSHLSDRYLLTMSLDLSLVLSDFQIDTDLQLPDICHTIRPDAPSTKMYVLRYTRHICNFINETQQSLSVAVKSYKYKFDSMVKNIKILLPFLKSEAITHDRQKRGIGLAVNILLGGLFL